MDALLGANLAILPSFSGDLFTSAELSAATQLVQLRGSTRGESSAPQKPTFSPSGSSSLSSVGTRRKAPLETETGEELRPRRRKKWRYRLVVDLYAAAERLVQAPPIAPPRKALRVRSYGGRQGRCRRLRHPVQEETEEEESVGEDETSTYKWTPAGPAPLRVTLHWFVLLLPVTEGSSLPTSRRRPQDRDPATFAIVVEVGSEEIYIVVRDIGVLNAAATGETEHCWSTGFKLTPAENFADGFFLH
ncbi:unnamed protein product [Musa acuminata subsp. burmannicoides]